MPPILFKDVLVEIRHSLGRFLSIMAIVALGVSFFAGIKASAPDMKNSADSYFDDFNVQDIQLYSTIGLDDKDVQAIEKLNGVEQVQPVFSSDYLTKRDNRELVVKVISMNNDQEMNEPRLVEGRMPEAPDECLLEADSATSKMFGTFSLGDRITLYSGTDTPVSDDLNCTTFIVVGKAYNPNYLSYELGSSSVGSGSVDTFIYVEQDAIKADYYTEIDVTVAGAKDLDTYSDEYFDVVDPVVTEIENIADTRIAARIKEKQNELNEAKQKLNASLAQAQEGLDAGKLELDDAKAQIQSGLKEISDNEALLASSKEELDAGWDAYNSNKQTLAASAAQVESGIAQIQQAQAQLPALEAQKSQLETAISLLPTLNNGITAIQKAQSAYEDARRQVEEYQEQNPESEVPSEILQAMDDALSALDSAIASFTGTPGLTVSEAIAKLEASRDEIVNQIGSVENGKELLSQVEDGIAQIEALDDQLTKLEEAKKEIESGQAQLAASYQTLVNAQVQYTQGLSQIEEAKEELAEGQKEYENGLEEYDKNLALFNTKKLDSEEQIDAAQKQIDDMDGKWIVLDRDSHYSYRDYEACAQRMDGIASVFPVFFFLVAALVCMTTMTRMVDEQRNEMGTLKALGYSKFQIGMKYIIYAGLASVVGCIVGCSIGMVVFPYIIFTAWNAMYNLPVIRFTFQPGLILMASFSVIAVVLAATILSIWKELLEVPAQLMRPKAAKAGKKILLERIPWLWKRFSFMQKVTLRNLFRYKKRFFMTVIGIAGCSALLVSGFGLNDSISDIVPAQFEKIYQYNAEVTVNDGTGAEMVKEVEKIPGVESAFDLEVYPITVHYDNKDVSGDLNVVSDPTAFEEFMKFYEVDSIRDKQLSLSDEGVLLSVKTAEKLGLSVGDNITFKTTDDQEITAKVAGIFEQYIGHEIYATEALAKTWKITETPTDTLLLRNSQTDSDFESDLGSEIMNLSDAKSVTFYSAVAQNFLDMISSIQIIVVVLVLSAAMLAFVVLYNLSNVNISERIREIATIKVLGFTEREVNSYVNRESVLLALIGGVVGLFLGIYLHNLIMNLAELDTIRFGRTILWQSFAYSIVLTMVFALIVNWIMKFQLRKIEMVESLKAVE